MSDTNPTPSVGQVWADNDERTKHSGEFEIVEIDYLLGIATVKRGKHKSKIRVDRLADTGSRGYRYIGKSR